MHQIPQSNAQRLIFPLKHKYSLGFDTSDFTEAKVDCRLTQQQLTHIFNLIQNNANVPVKLAKVSYIGEYISLSLYLVVVCGIILATVRNPYETSFSVIIVLLILGCVLPTLGLVLFSICHNKCIELYLRETEKVLDENYEALEGCGLSLMMNYHEKSTRVDFERGSAGNKVYWLTLWMDYKTDGLEKRFDRVCKQVVMDDINNGDGETNGVETSVGEPDGVETSAGEQSSIQDNVQVEIL